MSRWYQDDVNNGPSTGTSKFTNTNSNTNKVNNTSTPSNAVSNNAPTSSGNSGVTVGQSPSSDYHNGMSEAEYNYYFGSDDDGYSSYYDSGYTAALAAYQAAIEAQKKAEEEALAKQQAAIQAGRDQAVNTLNLQKETTRTEYADMDKQLYLDSMKSKKNLNQQLALQGLTGGASESAILGIDTDYANNLASGKASEEAAYKEIANSIANAQLAASADEATAIADNAKESASNYTSAMQNLLNLAATERQNRISAANSANSENKQYAYNYAMALISAGQMPSDSLLASAGISSTDAASLVAANTKSTSSGGSSSSTSKTTSNSYPDAGYVYTDALRKARTGSKDEALDYLTSAYTDKLISYAQLTQYRNAINSNF